MKKKIKLISKSAFETTLDGKEIGLYTLDAGGYLVMQITNYGGRVVSIWAPDKKGEYEDVALGYENIQRYIDTEGERYLGAVVGRYANRIADGKFTLDGKEYTLPKNNDVNCLHGGIKGLDKVVWDVKEVTRKRLHLFYSSPDGEEGFPGKLDIDMIYSLNEANEFKIEYRANTDKPTYVNLSHHSFFNLKGEGNGTAMDNVLTINADKIVPINEVSIPLGQLMSVEKTPFDFRLPRVIKSRINDENEQLKNGSGYDHCWVINKKIEKGIEVAATVLEPYSGRTMEVWTNQPGIQFYSSNFFDNTTLGKHEKPLKQRESIALEVQKFPDSPNHPDFPSTRLNPNEEYHHVCIYKFGVKK